MRLLLHGCCADCTLKYLISFSDDQLVRLSEKPEVTVYYYNPNIQPRSEYLARLKAIQKICEENKVKLIVADWSPREYFAAQIRNMIHDSRLMKKNERCPRCWELRISKTAEYAKENGYEAFSSTLVTSQYQNSEVIKKIAEKNAKKLGVRFYVPEIVCRDLKTKGFYKQIYCGCVYSLAERYEEKY